jgi:hypothetical protein
MAVDVVLVLNSEHRRLAQLVERCGRPRRGLHDPAAELQQALHAHMVAATAEIYPAAARRCPPRGWPGEGLTGVRVAAEQEPPDVGRLQEAAQSLVTMERETVIPALDGLEVPARRRLGKVFRIRRDAAARNAASSHRRHRTQTELYEVARRVGIEHRSRMTQAQLQSALQARGISV